MAESGKVAGACMKGWFRVRGTRNGSRLVSTGPAAENRNPVQMRQMRKGKFHRDPAGAPATDRESALKDEELPHDVVDR